MAITSDRWATVVDRLEQSIAARADAPAVVARDGTLSYDQLSDRADHLAARLRTLGIAPGELVGLCVKRSASLVVAVLGIVRAGGAYVAIDPAYPDARVRWLLDDAAVGATVTDHTNASRCDGSCTVVLGDAGELAEGDADDLGDPAKPSLSASDLAYVVYTSGSTGDPKGVMVEHGSLTNLVDWHCTQFGLSAEDHTTQISSPGFDAVVWEIWPSLAAGACLHVVPEELRTDPVGLRDWLVAQAITHTFVPTVVAETLIGLPWPRDTALRHLLTGGDALAGRPRTGLDFTVVNNYGLSETAVVATSGPVTPEGAGVPGIGRPIAGVVADIVDERLQLVGEGESGELMVGGVAVARGYLHADEPSADRFVTDDRGRRYRTGDRARRRAGGEIEFLGRIDDQLSIRGFRVEPGEVIAALTEHPAVAAAAVTAAGRTSAERRLVAHLVAAGDAAPAFGELDAFLSSRLPRHLVPSNYVWRDSLPLTAHGKLDREALARAAEPAPSAALSPAGPAAVGDTVEGRIATAVAELLDVDEIGRDENFFLRGGHSMLGAQLIVRLEDMFGAEISLRFLFDHPTPAELAREVQRQVGDEESAATVPG